MFSTKVSSLVAMSALVFCGCTSSIKKATPADVKSMEEVYYESTTDVKNKLEQRKQEILARRAHAIEANTGYPAYPEKTAHLFPAIPNPDLHMYVRPHAVGETGIPIPGYYTRFTMYERTHYALPGETLDTVREDAE